MGPLDNMEGFEGQFEYIDIPKNMNTEVSMFGEVNPAPAVSRCVRMVFKSLPDPPKHCWVACSGSGAQRTRLGGVAHNKEFIKTQAFGSHFEYIEMSIYRQIRGMLSF